MFKTHNPLNLFGGAEGDRTPGLMNAIHALSQLSYSPTRKNDLENKIKNNKILDPLSTIFLTAGSPLNIIFLENSTLYSFSVPCRRGGTGRRAGLKIPCPLGTCRFDSDRRHHIYQAFRPQYPLEYSIIMPFKPSHPSNPCPSMNHRLLL